MTEYGMDSNSLQLLKLTIFKVLIVVMIILCLSVMILSIINGIPWYMIMIQLLFIFVSLLSAWLVFKDDKYVEGILIFSIFYCMIYIPTIWFISWHYKGLSPVLYMMGIVIFTLLLEGRPRRIMQITGLLSYLVMIIIDAFTYISWNDVSENNQFIITNAAYIAVICIIVITIAALLKEYDKMGKKLFNQSITDMLTNTYNYGYAIKILDRILHRANRDNNPMSIILLDFDKFKAINDRYGHESANVFLRVAAEKINNMLRPNDVLARYGGDEFIVVLPNTDIENAKVVGERMRKAVMNIKTPDEDFKLSISLGVGDNYKHKETSELIAAIDDVMYKAKEMGRNRLAALEH